MDEQPDRFHELSVQLLGEIGDLFERLTAGEDAETRATLFDFLADALRDNAVMERQRH